MHSKRKQNSDHKTVKNLANLYKTQTKAILVFPKNFLNFRFKVVEKQSIVNISRLGSTGYTPVVLGNSEVTFLEER